MSEQKIALVTGASRGIGHAIASKLASQGMLVIVHASTETSARQAAEAICAAGGQAEPCWFRVEDSASVQAALKDLLARHGKIDVLVNNAGITRDGLAARMSDEDFADVMAVDLQGVFYCTRAVLRSMMKQRYGRIINIASVSGILGNPGQANYSAAKAGVIGMTKAIARETVSRGITVNAVAPGFIDTDMTRSLSESVREQAAEQIPMKRFGQPEDIAEAVAFLAAETSGYITGQVLSVDGGMAM